MSNRCFKINKGLISTTTKYKYLGIVVGGGGGGSTLRVLTHSVQSHNFPKVKQKPPPPQISTWYPTKGYPESPREWWWQVPPFLKMGTTQPLLHFVIYSLGMILHLWTLYRQAVHMRVNKSLLIEPTELGIHLE